jgi:hypothetical protein
MREGVIDEPQVLVILGEDKLRTKSSFTPPVDAPRCNYPLYGRVELIILQEFVYVKWSLSFRDLDWLFPGQRQLVSSASKILVWEYSNDENDLGIFRTQP